MSRSTWLTPATRSGSGTRSQSPSARSRSDSASWNALTRSAAAAARTEAASAAGWSPAASQWCATSRGQVHAVALVLERALERARDRAVQLGPLARQQVVVDDLAQQRVAEAVAAVGVRDRDLAADRLAQPLAQLGGVEAGELAAAGRRPSDWQASQRSTSCAGADSRSTRSISASRSVGGSVPRPSRPTASSSSVNSGLPSLRV